MFLAIDASTNAALKILDDIGKKVENYQYDTDGLKENLLSLIAKTNEKKEYFRNNFLKRK
jgi:hypothetical protein